MEKSELSNQRSERKLPPPLKVAPWLVVPHGKDRKFQTFCDIFADLDTRKTLKKFIPELTVKLFWQKNSNQGWVVARCCDEEDPYFNYEEFFLWNPASLETIHLPRVPDLVNDYSVRDCVLSSPPRISSAIGVGDGSSSSSSLSGSSSFGSSSFGSSDEDDDVVDYDSMVYILFDGGESPDVLIYCHPGEKQWRKHEFVVEEEQSFQFIFYFKGKLFITCLGDTYIEIAAIQHGAEDAETLSISEPISVASNFQPELVAGGLEYRLQEYHLEAFGEVLKVDRYFYPRGIHDNCVTRIHVWKLDFSSMTWEDVKTMDDYVLFLSDFTQVSCLASDLGLSKGCVYFTQEGETSLYRYDLEDDSVLLSLPCPNLPAPWRAPLWLMISAAPRFDGTTGTADHVLGKDAYSHEVIKATEEDRAADKDAEKADPKEAGPWIMLNDDHMVWLISNYLHTLDYVHLRGVGKKYRAMLNPRRSSTTGTGQTTDLSPWLVFHKGDPAAYSFVNPMHNNENYLVNIPELLKGFRIRFSKGGWLLLSKGKTLFLYNPFTKSTVKLPDLPDSYHAFTGISFSSLPTSSDCIVFGVGIGDRDGVVIFFIKRGDESWTHGVFGNIYLPPRRKNVDFELNFNNPVFYRGAFYCLDLHGNLGVFKLEHGISWGILAMATPPNCEFIYKSFLVECDGKLMAVLLGHLGKWVRLFRLDDTEMVWVEVKRLGRHMLCISNTSCASAVAPSSRMENKIYFPRLHNEGILYYSLDTGMYHCFGSKHSAKDYRDSKENLHCTWIEPNWSETSDYYLDWRNI